MSEPSIKVLRARLHLALLRNDTAQANELREQISRRADQQKTMVVDRTTRIREGGAWR